MSESEVDRGEHWAGQPWPPTELCEVRRSGNDPFFYRYDNVREVAPGMLVTTDRNGVRYAVMVGSEAWASIHPSWVAAIEYVSSVFLREATALIKRSHEYSAMADAVAAADGEEAKS